MIRYTSNADLLPTKENALRIYDKHISVIMESIQRAEEDLKTPGLVVLYNAQLPLALRQVMSDAKRSLAALEQVKRSLDSIPARRFGGPLSWKLFTCHSDN